MHRTDRPDEGIRIDVLVQHASRPGPHGLLGARRLGHAGQTSTRAGRAERFEHRDTVHPGQLEVEQHDVRPQRRGELHEPRSSHLRMLAAFHGPDLLDTCYDAALPGRYLWHEFGDVHLLMP
jgi:hypothetical protein